MVWCQGCVRYKFWSHPREAADRRHRGSECIIYMYIYTHIYPPIYCIYVIYTSICLPLYIYTSISLIYISPFLHPLRLLVIVVHMVWWLQVCVCERERGLVGLASVCSINGLCAHKRLYSIFHYHYFLSFSFIFFSHCSTTALLRRLGFSFWDLDSPMQYKRDMGAIVVSQLVVFST